MAYSGIPFKPPSNRFLFVRVGVQIVARALIIATAVAGFGVVGLFGPRVGNSSGVCPGNSSGANGP